MNLGSTLVSCLTALALAPSSFASFHLMQVEQVIASMDGNISAQAIQLRMREPGQFQVSQTRLRVWNSEGTQPVMILNIGGDVIHYAAGARILLATQAFTDIVRVTSPQFTPDFTILNPIPQNNLTAGRLTYETDQGFVIWSLAWGGNFYIGSNAGSLDNDANGNYGPPIPRSLPTRGRQGVLFKGPADALSTSNSANYVLSADPATVTINSGRSFIIGPAPEIAVVLNGNSLRDGVTRKKFGPVAVGSTGTPQTFTIVNTGNSRLANLKLTKKGSNPADFSFSKLSKTALLPGQSVEFDIAFKPRATGFRKVTLGIESTDANENPFDIKLQGNGTAP